MRRRRFVGALLAGTAALGIGLGLGSRDFKARYLSSRWTQKARRRLDGLDPSTGTGALNSDLEARLWALAIVLLPSQIHPAGRSAVLEQLRWRALESPGYRTAFADGLAFLDRETKRRFPGRRRFGELPRDDANQILGPLLAGIKAYPRFRELPRDLLMSFLDRARTDRFRLRRHVVGEILHAYYQSGAGWALVGYDTYPGLCAGLDSYSRAPRPPRA
jgi:hypothetical protein